MIILRLTTHVCHAKEKVEFNSWHPQEPDNNPKLDSKNGPYIPIRQLLEGLGITSIFEADAYNQDKLRTLVKQAINEDHFNVVIAKHPCMLLFAKKQRKAQVFNPLHVQIDQEKCRHIHVCIQKFQSNLTDSGRG